MNTNTELQDALNAVAEIDARLDLAKPLMDLAIDLTNSASRLYSVGKLDWATETLAIANKVLEMANKHLTA